MATSKADLLGWLAGVPDDAQIGIDDELSGLEARVNNEAVANIEVGGLPTLCRNCNIRVSQGEKCPGCGEVRSWL